MASRTSRASASGAGRAVAFLCALLLIGGGLYVAYTRGWLSTRKPPTAVAPATPPPATPAPATPAPVVVAPPPPPPAPRGPTAEELAQARIEAAQAIVGVRTQMARGDFAGAARALDEWLATKGMHPQAAAVRGQAERLRAAGAVVPAMLARPAAIIGATIPAGNVTWKVMGVAEGRLKCQTKTQFGAVDRPIEVAALPPAALVPLLQRVDAAGQSTLAATYLLGFGRTAEARAAVPAAARDKEALLAGVGEWEAMAGDAAVVMALDGVGTLVHRGDLPAARQRLEQSRKLYGAHDLFTTAYAAKIADWTAKIASAPAPTAAAATPAPAPPVAKAATLPAAPALPAGALDAARAALLEGVAVAPRLGSQGPVAIYGAAAFPILTMSDEKGAEVVGAAGMAGKGRAVIFGHSGYIGSGAQADGDLGKLMLNAVKWCGGKARPRIGVKGCDLDGFLGQQSFRAEKFSGPLKKATLGDYDVVILNVGDLNDDEQAAALKGYLEGGGGVIAAMTGWAFPQFSQGRALYATNRANVALAGAGLAFTDNSIFGSASSLTAQRDPAPMLNAFTAIAALQQRFGGAPPPSLASLTARSTPGAAAPEASDADLEIGAAKVQLALEAMPPASKPAFLQALAGIVAGGKPIAPSMEAPLTEGMDQDARTRASVQARLLKVLPAEAIVAHPSAANFPGRVPAQARSVLKTVRINPAIPAWHSTGLYADAGARITVKLPAEAVAAGYEARIGCHSDAIYVREKWPRLPEITRTFPLTAAETTVSSAFGGLFYLVVPGSAKDAKPFEVTVSGAVEAPFFVLGETTDAQWRDILKRPAPWAELACRDLILSVPADVAREVRNPTEVMTYWQKAMEMHDDLSNVARDRRRPERMVPDLAISAGFMHSGYPIMLHLPEATPMVTVNNAKKPGWGYHHEIGHNQQKGEWTFDGTGEVTNNVFSLYLMEQLNGLKRGDDHGGVNPDNQAKKWARYARLNKPFAEWKSDPFLALGTYIQLIEGFGWDAMKRYFRSYQDAADGPKPTSDDEKRDQFMVRYSRVAGKNLGPFFDAWGIPVSASAKAEIASLPAWMPPGLK